jgi:group I intron endonuclease
MLLSGIYKITNGATGKVYIGSSINVLKRIRLHDKFLSSNKHQNKILQRAYNKDGSSFFIYECLEIVEDYNLLLLREQHYLDLYKSYLRKNGYNICKMAGSTLGRKKSEKEIERMSGVNSPTSKLSDQQLRSIINKYLTGSYTQRQLADQYNVSYGTICNLLKGKTYTIFFNSLEENTKSQIRQITLTLKDSTRNKMSESAKNKIISEETKKKYSERSKRIHEKNPDFLKKLFLGRKHSEETKKILREKYKIRVKDDKENTDN